MKKTLVNKIIIPVVLGVSLLVGSGCTTLYEKDPLVRGIVGGMPRILQPGAYRDVIEKEEREKEIKPESRHDPWKGTAVVNRTENKDGTIVFILNSRKIGRSINTNYADKFVDAEKYNKTWERYEGGCGFIIKYIPLEK